MPRPASRGPDSTQSRQDAEAFDWDSLIEEPNEKVETQHASPVALLRMQHEAVMQKLSLQESMLREVLKSQSHRYFGPMEVAKMECYLEKEIPKPPDEVSEEPEDGDEALNEAVSKVKSALTSYSNEDLSKKDSALKIHSKYLRNAFLKKGLKVKSMEGVVKAIVKHQLFEAFFALVVVSNSVFIGIEVARSINDPNAVAPIGIKVVQYTYTFLFTSELLLRVIAFGRKFLFSDDWMWALLDIFIVVSSLWEVAVDIIQAVYEQETNLDGMSAFMNMKTFRIIRLTRLLKTVQFVKIFRFVMALRMLVTSIMSTLKALFWALVLLILVVYVFGVLFAQAVNDPDVHLPDPENTEARRYFGTLEDSMLSLFMSIAGGVSWEQVIFPLRKISSLWVVAFLFYICFTYFAVLNVVTGVFCQSAMESANNDHAMVVQSMLDNKAAHLAKIRTLFDELGTEGGVLTLGVFEDKINTAAVREYFEALGLDVWDAWSFFKLLDEDSDGSVEIEEFFMGCLRFRGAARSMDVGRLIQDQKWLIKNQGRVQHYLESEFQSLHTMIQDLHDVIRKPVLGQEGNSHRRLSKRD